MMGSQLVVLRIFCLGKFWCPGNWGSEMIARLETCRAAYLYIYIYNVLNDWTRKHQLTGYFGGT